MYAVAATYRRTPVPTIRLVIAYYTVTLFIVRSALIPAITQGKKEDDSCAVPVVGFDLHITQNGIRVADH
jgi:hypothetical protein